VWAYLDVHCGQSLEVTEYVGLRHRHSTVVSVQCLIIEGPMFYDTVSQVRLTLTIQVKKGKAIPVTGRGGL
jgi:hypothetical protein